MVNWEVSAWKKGNLHHRAGPQSCRSYGRDVEGLFGEVADVSVFSVMDGSAMGVLPHADLFAASTDAFGSPEELARHVPIDSQTMAVQASFRWQEPRRLEGTACRRPGAVCQHDGDHGPGRPSPSWSSSASPTSIGFPSIPGQSCRGMCTSQ